MFAKLKILFQKDVLISVIKLGLPITIGQLGLVLMGTIDIMMLGRVSKYDVGGASVGNSIFFLVTLLGIGFMFAVGTLVSVKMGEKKPKSAVSVFLNSLKISIVISLVLMFLNELAYHQFYWLKQTKEVTNLGKNYLRIVNWSVPAIMLFNASKQMLDGLGKTKWGMYVTYFGLALNVLLNYLMIFGHWGFEPMGIVGAAWATVIARFAMAIIMFLITWNYPLVKQYVKENNHENFTLELCKLGIPIGFTFFFEIAAFSICLIFSGMISEIHLNAHQIAINIASITYMFITGIAAAANIKVGYYFGMKDSKSVRLYGMSCIAFALVLEFFFMLLFLLFPQFLSSLFTEDIEVLKMASGLLVFAALFQLTDGLQAVAAGALRGIKQTTFTGIVALISYWVVMIPLAYILCFNFKLSIQGIWYGINIGLLVVSLVMFWRFYMKSKKIELGF